MSARPGSPCSTTPAATSSRSPQSSSEDNLRSPAVLDGLKGFQRDTVEYAFERLYRAPDSTRRFLVADEVGLGKTLVARGVIATALDHLWEGPDSVEQIYIVYICSNAQIARQNVRRLQIGCGRFVRAARSGLLLQEIHGLKENRVNYLALTPGTSFDLRISMGRREERVLLYHLLQRVWPDPRKGPMNLLQGYVKNTGHFRWELEFKRRRRIDYDIAYDSERRILKEGKGFQERYEDLCKRFWRSVDRQQGPNPGEFNLPHNIALGPNGNLYVADRQNSRIQVFTPVGEFVSEWTELERPNGIAIGQDGLVYIASMGMVYGHMKGMPEPTHRSPRSSVSVYDLDGNFLAKWGKSTMPGPGSFTVAHAIAVDSAGDLYVGEVLTDPTRNNPPKGARVLHKFERIDHRRAD